MANGSHQSRRSVFPIYNLRQKKVLDVAGLRDDWGVAPEQVVDLLALTGDTSDNVPGVPGIGLKIAESVREFFTLPENRAVVEKLRAAGVNLREESGGAREGPLNGLTFVITGRLEHFSRDGAERLVKRSGGNVASSVSKKTSYIIVGEEPGSKLAKAQQLGTEVLDEDAFIAVLRERGIDTAGH